MNFVHTLINEEGGTRTVARQLNVPPSTVQGWKRAGRIPASRLLQIEAVLGIPRQALRPELYDMKTLPSPSTQEAQHV